MQTALHVTHSELTRQEELDLWLKRKGSSYAAIGRCLGVSRNSALLFLKGDTLGHSRLNDLKCLRIKGEPIPEHLLPKERIREDVVSSHPMADAGAPSLSPTA